MLVDIKFVDLLLLPPNLECLVNEFSVVHLTQSFLWLLLVVYGFDADHSVGHDVVSLHFSELLTVFHDAIDFLAC